MNRLSWRGKNIQTKEVVGHGWWLTGRRANANLVLTMDGRLWTAFGGPYDEEFLAYGSWSLMDDMPSDEMLCQAMDMMTRHLANHGLDWAELEPSQTG